MKNISPLSDKVEYSLLSKTRELKDKILNPLIKITAKAGISPNTLTLLSFISLSLTPIAYIYNQTSCLILIILHFLFDGLDGGVARKNNRTSKNSALIDILSDNISYLVFYLGVVTLNITGNFWSYIYITLQAVSVFLLIIKPLRIEKRFTFIKSRLIGLLLFFIFTIFSTNYFNYFEIIFSLYLTLVLLIYIKKNKNE